MSSLCNFIKIVKRDVFKVKDKPKSEPELKNKDKEPPSLALAGEISGWSSYKFYSGGSIASYAGESFVPPYGRNRQFYTYNQLGDSPGKYMTRTFNAICSEAGVECTVAMDPTDYQQIYHFKNLSNRLVRIEWDNEIRLIEPGETVTVKARGAAYSEATPRITPLNNGVA